MASPTDNKAEPFPALSPIESVPTNLLQQQPPPRSKTQASENDNPSTSATSSPNSRRRTSSIRQSFLHSNPPLGMWQATGEVTSKVPTLAEIRNGSFSADGWHHEGQMEKRGANPHEIHRRRLARTSSASTRTFGSSNAAPTTPISPTIVEQERQSEDHGEARQYFPRRGSLAVREVTVQEAAQEKEGTNVEVRGKVDKVELEQNDLNTTATTAPTSLTEHPTGPDQTGSYPNGYRFPRKHTFWQSTTISFAAFGKFVLTPMGFAITLYGLNVVGWGAMIFFLLLNAAPAMCNPSCDDKHYSARQIWIEIDSQVLNALFCVTAFGLLPWRARDFYYLMRWRWGKDETFHRRLAGIYRGWYRLPGSQNLHEDVGPPPKHDAKNPAPVELSHPYSESEITDMENNPAIALPVSSMPDPPLTGIRAQPSRSWSLDFVIWMYLLNTVLQCFLCGFMWGYNRYTRPSWAVGLFITLGCFTGIFAGIMVFVEGKKVKAAEGIPIREYDVLESIDDFQKRKHKEDEKLQKKESRHTRRVERTEKVKGHMWFTRQ